MISRKNRMPKNQFYHLTAEMQAADFHPEIKEKLEVIAALSQRKS